MVKDKHDEVCNEVKMNKEKDQEGYPKSAKLVDGLNMTMTYRKYWKSVDKTVHKHVRSLNDDIHPSYFHLSILP